MPKATKKALSFVLSFIMLLSLFVPTFAETQTTDYANHWANATIQQALADQIVTGYPNGNYAPDQSITRAEFFTLINKAFNYTVVTPINYTDVPVGTWYANEIARAKQAGYVSGYPDGSMHPDAFISRQEVALVLSKLNPLTVKSTSKAFTDAASIAAWSKGAIDLVRGAHVMVGYPDGSFKPTAQIKRAEALVAVIKSLNYKNASIDTPVQVSSVKFLEDTLTLFAGGQTGLLNTVVSPSSATNQSLVWSSSNPEVATVKNGIVTPLSSGTTIITATSVDRSSLVAKATITVNKSGPIVSEPTIKTVDLGTAENFAILSKAGISTVPPSVIKGDIGTSPIGATALTGFSLSLDATNVFSTSPQITGKAYASDYTAPTASRLTTAISDMETAFTDAAGRASDFTELYSGDISGKTLVPGVYKWGTGVLISSDVTLDGGPDAIWIFQIGNGITQASGSKIILKGGAQAKNIFWQAASTVSIGSGAHMEGIILCQTNITMATNASIVGRLLSQTAVTLDASTVTAPR